MKETNEFDVLLRVVEVIEKKITLQYNSITHDSFEKIKVVTDKINLIVNHKTEIKMGDEIKIEKSQIGAVGSNAQASNNTFNQQLNSLGEKFDFEKLSTELLRLRGELASKASETEHFKALGEVAKAEEASKEKDENKVMEHLKSAGKWVFDTAKDIGVEVVAEIINKQMM